MTLLRSKRVCLSRKNSLGSLDSFASKRTLLGGFGRIDEALKWCKGGLFRNAGDMLLDAFLRRSCKTPNSGKLSLALLDPDLQRGQFGDKFKRQVPDGFRPHFFIAG